MPDQLCVCVCMYVCVCVCLFVCVREIVCVYPKPKTVTGEKGTERMKSSVQHLRSQKPTKSQGT
jgi:hypothetical protein